MGSNLDIILDRDGLRPEDLDAEELGKFIANFAALIRKASGRQDAAVTGLAAIESNCIRLRFAASRYALIGYAAVMGFERGHPYRRLRPRTDWNPHVAEINRFCERNAVQVAFPLNGRRGDQLKVSAERKLGLVEPRQTTMATTIYGEVENVGGASRANVHLRYKGRSLVCTLSRELAKELGRRLYETVGLTGEATLVDREVVDFRVTGVSAFQPSDDPLRGLRQLEERYGHYDEVDAGLYVAEQRG